MSKYDCEKWSPKERKEWVLGVVGDSIADFLYYDRKECEQFPRGEIDRMVRDGEVTEEEIVQAFAKALKEGLTR